MEPNFDLLSEILDINLNVPPEKFDMRDYISECGTVHCLVGNYLKKYSIFPLGKYVNNIQNDLGIAKNEYDFLFIRHDGKVKNAVYLTQKEALTRLAKFIIYKRRKKDMWERYRQTEGDKMFCQITPAELELELINVN